MKIALIEPFYAGSHKLWADGLKSHFDGRIDLYTLPGRHWKWRMHGGAVTLARKILDSNINYDLIIATDMVDLPVFRALTRSTYANTKVALYFHENQLTYPWSPDDEDPKLARDNHYAFINYTSALAADHIWFNSEYHKTVFINALPDFLKSFPDYRETDNVVAIQNKSSVLHLGLDLSRFDAFKHTEKEDSLLILWNHRWEYDKNPEAFFETLFLLKERSFPFKVAVIGESYKSIPPIFEQAREILSDHIVHWGYCEKFEDYAYWLWKADLLPVTSNQDFFGMSVVEATYCNTIPLVPDRLVYNEYIDEANSYVNDNSLADKIAEYKSLSRQDVSRFNWSEIIQQYSNAFSAVVND